MYAKPNCALVSLSLCATCLTAGAQGDVAASSMRVPRDTFFTWMTRMSNSGRWGPQDQLGTLNLITPEKRKAAAQSVREGISVSLASDLVAGPDPNAFLPMRLNVAVNRLDSTTTAAIDSITILAHGYAFSHLDALSHFLFREHLYNGFAADQLSGRGAAKLGVEAMREGIITRGVLIDMPRLRGVPYLQPSDVVTTQDIATWEQRNRVQIEPGDVVLIRTGRAVRTTTTGPWQVARDAAGPHPALAVLLKERGVAALGSDVANERYPSLVPGVVNPLHTLAIVALGMPLMDDLNLEDVAREAFARARPTFLFVVAPLRIRGGTGSPVNPLAIF